MNNKFDAPRTEEMQQFLELIHQNALNSDTILSWREVYKELKRYGLGKDNLNEDGSLLDVRDNFRYWVDHVDNHNHNIRAFVSQRHAYWAQFMRSPGEIPEMPFIKLYIPMDKEHIQIGVEQLFRFISTLDVPHASKVGQDLRSDGIVVRVAKEDAASALKIIDFVNSNPYIKQGLLKPNPFVPVVNNVGFMVDYGRSYNSVMANTIAEYINLVLRENKTPSIEEFYDKYIRNATGPVPEDITSDELAQDIKDAFEIACGVASRDMIDIPEAKDNKEVPKEFNENQKRQLIVDALTATYSKYGKGQCVAAIKAIIYYDNFDLISNGNGSVKYRGALKMNVNKAELENFIRSTMIMLNPDNEKQPLGYLIDEFIRFFVSKDISKRFADACAVTLDKYGENWLADAIERYIENDDPRGFSRTSNNVDPENKDVNYRIEITKIDKDDCVMAMKSYLFEQGIDVSYLPGDTLYNMYVDALSRTRGNTVGSSAR